MIRVSWSECHKKSLLLLLMMMTLGGQPQSLNIEMLGNPRLRSIVSEYHNQEVPAGLYVPAIKINSAFPFWGNLNRGFLPAVAGFLVCSRLWVIITDPSVLWGPDALIVTDPSVLWGPEALIVTDPSILWGPDALIVNDPSVLWGPDAFTSFSYWMFSGARMLL